MCSGAIQFADTLPHPFKTTWELEKTSIFEVPTTPTPKYHYALAFVPKVGLDNIKGTYFI